MKLSLGLNQVSNEAYHADKEFLSSSDLKLILDDPAKFYDEKVLGNRGPQEESPALAEGSLTHSLILEPHLVANEYAIFPGLRKAGPDWEDFKLKYADKTIVSAPQKQRCLKNLESFRRSKPAVELITGGYAEQSICALIQDIKIKTRCDYINLEKNYIVDVKTSSFPVAPKESFLFTIDRYKYDLSAALYCQVAENYYGRPFTFYFVAIAKPKSLLELGECVVYRVSKETREKGNHMVSQALHTYKKCWDTGLWAKPVAEFKDNIEEV